MESIASSKRLQPKELFAALLKKKRMSHAYLLEGPAGTGKKALALWTASAILCLDPDKEGQPCGECANCRRVSTNQHPDVVEIRPEGQSIKVDQVRLLKSEFSKSGMESSRKVFI